MNLYPTPSRVALLKAVRAGGVYRDAATHEAYSGTLKVTARLAEMFRAGWVLLDQSTETYALTTEGERVLSEVTS